MPRKSAEAWTPSGRRYFIGGRTRGSSWATTRRPYSACGAESAGRSSRKTFPATSSSGSGVPNPQPRMIQSYTGRTPERFGRPVNQRAGAALVNPREATGCLRSTKPPTPPADQETWRAYFRLEPEAFDV